jgi:dephospho-CoA kinase
MIIGIAGTLGAGKGTVVKHLVERYGFQHQSARAFIVEELDRRGLPPIRDNMSWVADELRTTHHPGYIVEQLYERAKESGRDAVIESLHALGEASNLREKGNFILLGVDADRRIRYERIQLRGSTTDSVTYEKFVEDEEKELRSDDPRTHNIFGLIQAADYVINNNGTPEALAEEVDRFMAFARRTG